ncbi:MAG: hypothetical protein FWF69_03095 [Firmicutes bacterium]|nr:hypothetical protein [Bacillota bacterium]
MPHPSPFDLIQKASRRATAADRWAALKVNTQQRIPLVNKQQKPAPPELPYPAYQEERPVSQIPQPPFSPPSFPQPHHPHVDEVAQRHEQAWKNAMPLQTWTTKPAQDKPLAGQAPVFSAPASQAQPQTPDDA